MRKDYFKGFKLFKTVQLIILLLFAVTFFLYLYLDDELRTHVFSNKTLMTICVFLWAFMIYSVACIVLDFYQLEGHIAYNNVLSRAVYTDALTGIPNRHGVDRIFEEYSNGKDISKLGCALIKISNLDEVNHNKGRITGNILLVDFSRIMERVGAHYGFVGRNNGNEFLTVIDNCDQVRIEQFANELNKEISVHNGLEGSEPIQIEMTKVLNQDVKIDDFTGLIVRLYENVREK